MSVLPTLLSAFDSCRGRYWRCLPAQHWTSTGVAAELPACRDGQELRSSKGVHTRGGVEPELTVTGSNLLHGFRGDYAQLANVPAVLSAFTNDQAFASNNHDASFSSVLLADLAAPFTGDYSQLGNLPDLNAPLAQVAAANYVSNGSHPTFASVTLPDARAPFTGDYAQLANSPAVLSAFANDLGFVSNNQPVAFTSVRLPASNGAFVGNYVGLTGAPTALSAFRNDWTCVRHESGLDKSLVQRGRNILTKRFLASPATHLFFIDADIGYSAESVFRLLDFDRMVVTGCYPKKFVNWANVARKLETPPVPGEPTEPVRSYGLDYNINIKGSTATAQNGFVQVLDSATGFMLIKRAVIERMYDHYKDTLFCVNDIIGDAAAITHDRPRDTSLFVRGLLILQKMATDGG